MSRVLAPILALTLAGCLPPEAPPAPPPRVPAAAPAGPDIDALEAALLRAPAFTCRFSIQARGPVPASLSGLLCAGAGNRVRVDAEGELEGKPAAPHLVADGRVATGGGDKTFSVAAPPAIADAVLLGFVRMGLLHNLAGLAHGEVPDGADGSFRGRVTVGDAKRSPAEPSRVDFNIVVEGQTRGESHLWLDPRTRMPVRRHTTVHMAEGDLQVDETYAACGVAAAPPGPDVFEPAPVPLEI